jgi:hypothetical protein
VPKSFPKTGASKRALVFFVPAIAKLFEFNRAQGVVLDVNTARLSEDFSLIAHHKTPLETDIINPNDKKLHVFSVFK